jgi:RimJ/RimL family protein N-acetyltransferase
VNVELASPRLRLRQFRPDDIDDLHAMDGDDRVMRYLGTGLAGRTREQSVRALELMIAHYAQHPGYGLLHGSRRDDTTFVGACGVFPLPGADDIEIAYRLPHACWGQGYATEMAKAVLDYAFHTLGLPRIVGITWPENLASQRVLVKIGMRDARIAVHYGRPMRVFSATRETLSCR